MRTLVMSKLWQAKVDLNRNFLRLEIHLWILKLNFAYKNVFENEFQILENDILIHVQYKKINF